MQIFNNQNFRTEIPAILPMGDNLDYHKMTFCGFNVYLSIITSKQNFGLIILSDPQGLQFITYPVEKLAFAL